MADIDRAKQVYRELATLPWLGPFDIVEKGTERKYRDVWCSAWKVAEEVQVAKERVAWAPSAWHAVVFGMILVKHSTSLDKDIDKRAVIEAGVLRGTTPRQRPLFRGHPDSEWKFNLTPRFERRETQKKTQSCAIEALCGLLDYICKAANVAIPKEVHIATAQHYGLATQLLDFTPDPAVAVFFAATGDRVRKEQQAVLFVVRHIDAVARHMAQIILPPPFVKRLYLQNGIFLEVRGRRRTSQLRKDCMEIRFPLDDSFRVIRGGKEVKLLPPDPWLGKATMWAKFWASAYGRFPKHPSSVKAVLDWACEELKCGDYINREKALQYLPEWMYFTFQMLAWLAVRMSEDAEVFGLDEDVLNAIKRDNPALLRMFSENAQELKTYLKYNDEGKLANTLVEFFKKWDVK